MIATSWPRMPVQSSNGTSDERATDATATPSAANGRKGRNRSSLEAEIAMNASPSTAAKHDAKINQSSHRTGSSPTRPNKRGDVRQKHNKTARRPTRRSISTLLVAVPSGTPALVQNQMRHASPPIDDGRT